MLGVTEVYPGRYTGTYTQGGIPTRVPGRLHTLHIHHLGYTRYIGRHIYRVYIPPGYTGRHIGRYPSLGTQGGI